MDNQQKKNLSRGFLIAFEGIDGAGKTTQLRMLAEYLIKKGYDVQCLREPTDSLWGQKIRQLAREGRNSPEEELHLFVEDRKMNVRQNIFPALQRKQIVLIDRYYISTMAYQGARGLDVEYIRQINEAFAPIPDLVLILTLPPAQAIARLIQERGTGDLFEQEEYLTKVAAIFHSLCGKNICHIDASQERETVQTVIRTKVQALIASQAEDLL